MANNPNHYRTLIKMTSAEESKLIIIPQNVNIHRSIFTVGAIAGQMNNSNVGDALVHICSEDFATHNIFSTIDSSSACIAKCVLNTSNINFIPDEPTVNTLGFPVPSGLGYNPTVTFQLRDVDNKPLANLNFIEFDLDIVSYD